MVVPVAVVEESETPQAYLTTSSTTMRNAGVEDVVDIGRLSPLGHAYRPRPLLKLDALNAARCFTAGRWDRNGARLGHSCREPCWLHRIGAVCSHPRHPARTVRKGSPLDCLSGWGQRVVPVGVPVVAGDVEGSEFGIGDLDAFLVPLLVASGPDREPAVCRGR